MLRLFSLLIAIRQLLEALTLWSNENATEQQVSDVYVRLGNDFNLAVAAFSKYNIDMRYEHSLSISSHKFICNSF